MGVHKQCWNAEKCHLCAIFTLGTDPGKHQSYCWFVVGFPYRFTFDVLLMTDFTFNLMSFRARWKHVLISMFGTGFAVHIKLFKVIFLSRTEVTSASSTCGRKANSGNHQLQSPLSPTWYMWCELMGGNTDYNVCQLQSGIHKMTQQGGKEQVLELHTVFDFHVHIWVLISYYIGNICF